MKAKRIKPTKFMFKKPCKRCNNLFTPPSKWATICEKCRKPSGGGKKQ